MTVMKSVCTAVAALALMGSAVAQQAETGMIVRIDRINGTVSIKPLANGTVGASGTTGNAKQYKVQGVSLDNLHAGDRVSFSAKESGGVETVTKIEKRK